jgi:hypothetical protein
MPITSAAIVVALASGSASARPILLSSPHQDAKDPQVAVDRAGRTTVVWDAAFRFHHVVQVATRPAGGTSFSAPVNLAVHAAEAHNPQVVVDRAGNTTIVWVASIGHKRRRVIQAVTRRAGHAAFSAPVTLSTRDANAQEDALAVASDANGDTTVVWTVEHFRPLADGGVTNVDVVQTATRAAGHDTFSAPVTLSSPDENAQHPTVAVDRRGNATIAWQGFDYSTGTTSIQAATRPAGGTFTAAAALSIPGDYALYPRVAIDPTGSTTVAWILARPIAHPTLPDVDTRYLLQAVTRPASGAFGAPVTLSSSHRDAGDVDIAFDGAGNELLVYNASRPFHDSVVQTGARRAGSSTFSDPVSLPHQSGDAQTPHVAFDRQGDAIVVWVTGDFNSERVRAAIRPAGRSAFGAPRLLAGPLTSAMENTAVVVAIGPVGRATAVWIARHGHNVAQAATFSLRSRGRARDRGLDRAPRP